MTGPTRRVFLGALGTTVVAGRVARSAAATATAAERVRLGVIGVNGRGLDLARSFTQDQGSEVVAVCDPDTRTFAKAIDRVEKAGGKTPATHQDFRKLLDDPTIDAVAIAAPDHWHALMTVMACQAGKDVYVEKPVSHNLVEGRRMVQAARKYGKVVQAGTQRRSAEYIQDAIAHVHEGGIGKVGLARAWMHQKRSPIGYAQPAPPPAELDWALWQGPAPVRPFYPNRVHYNWHWFWDYGTGELGNNGIHGVDIARWGLNVDDPVRVTSSGGKFLFKDDQEVPDTQLVTWEFPGCALAWEHRMWSAHGEEGTAFGIAFHGDNGTLIIDGKNWRVEDGPTAGGPATELQAVHIANFLDCVRTRKSPNAEIAIGHNSTRLCHLGNIAHRTGKKLTFDAATETFTGDDEANALLGREYSHRFAMPEQV